MNIKDTEKIGFGGGCHWCTEAVFQSLKGVHLVEQGYISSFAPYAVLSEAVIVYFDSNIMDLSALIRIHLQTHSCTSAHNMRNKYRSAIYTHSQEQEREVIKIFDSVKNEFADKIITKVLPLQKFTPSAEKFQNYYKQDPKKPFCRTYIAPKLKNIKENFPDNFKKQS